MFQNISLFFKRSVTFYTIFWCRVLYICHLPWKTGIQAENQRSTVILLCRTVHSFYREGHLSRCKMQIQYPYIIYLHDTRKKMLTFRIRRYYFMKVFAIIIYVFETEMQDFIFDKLYFFCYSFPHGCPFLCGRFACMAARFLSCVISSVWYFICSDTFQNINVV